MDSFREAFREACAGEARGAARAVTPVTAHFVVEEFACHDGTPYPTEWVGDRLVILCNLLETLRRECGDRPIQIVSGYRTEAHNTSVGGAGHSQHLKGTAADIAIEPLSPREVYAALKRLSLAGVRIGAIGLYPAHVHVDTRPSGILVEWIDPRVRNGQA